MVELAIGANTSTSQSGVVNCLQPMHKTDKAKPKSKMRNFITAMKIIVFNNIKRFNKRIILDLVYSMFDKIFE